ncbi:hypothetical protein AMTRI_Chr06g178340 [Amborella trichopoda]|uniref:Cytochrome P450 n=1 Tax=Amborella trichopoda TaxID=13333 RepID=U5DI65_AMBTC|nr:cytochrome P450 81E8 [Amborella trichopoda]ERN20268.1 hypothetical protein AMTR_s00066p00166330 [Amborella trichopoda]|eukprot:XP_006858801.1 cytochrome P450 81E8 [Amborella trichopoda]
MELMLLVAFLLILATLYLAKEKSSTVNLPPGPRPLPFIGHFHLLKRPLYRSLSDLANQYGPIFSLRLGIRPVVIVSSASLAQECFSKNDITFASRPRLALGKYLGYNYMSVAWAPYGAHWRNLRRIQTLELLSSRKIEMFAYIRHEQVVALLQSIVEASDRGEVVQLKDRINETIFNSIVKMVAGKSYYGCGAKDLDEAKAFKRAIDETFTLSALFNMGDFIPWLSWLDLRGIRLMKALQRKRDKLVQSIVDEHRKLRSGECYALKPDFIHMLLAMKEEDPNYFTDDLIKSLVVVLIVAGTETTAVTLQWALALLLNHPDSLHKAQTELDQQVGRDRLVEESDLSKLRVPRAIINETLRLYPPVATLVPHESTAKCTLGGYTMPKGTILMVNAWHIQRDPYSWPEPLNFKPERFMATEADVKGQDYRVIPFGSGRRSCPGMGLALRSLEYVLASLLHAFEWERESPELVDMTVGAGSLLKMAVPLRALTTPRLPPHVYPPV